MDKFYNFTKALVVAIFALLILTTKVSASEGTIEMRSTTGDTFRCYAASIQLINLNYKILVTCRDLLYPAGEDIFTYMVWANTIDDEDPVRLGELGFGRAEFVIKRAFNELFVTTEKNKRTKTPEGPIVMRGAVEKIEFLDNPARTEVQDEEGEDTPSLSDITPSPTPSARERLVKGLRRAALVSILALVSLVGLIFVLTRKK